MTVGQLAPVPAVAVPGSAGPETDERRARWQAIVGDPVCRAGAVAGLGWLVLYAALLALSSGSPAGSRFVGVVVYLVPFLALTVLDVVAAKRNIGRTRRMWRLFSVAAVISVSGSLLWLLAAYVPALAVGATMAPALQVVALLVLVPGVLIGFGGANLLRHARGLVDAALLAITLGGLGWYLLVEPRLSRTLDFDGFVSVAFPLLDVVVLVCLLSAGLAGHRTVPYAVLVATSGLVAGVLTDGVVSYVSISSSLGDGGWANLGWQAEGVLFCLAALIAARHHEPEAQVLLMTRDFSMPLLVVPAVSVSLVLFIELGLGRIGLFVLVVVMMTGPLVRQLLTIRDRTRLADALEVALGEQERLAATDALTGVYNRRYFHEALRTEGRRAARTGRPVALVIFDLDHFKRVNDGYGHPAGDAVLVETAARLRLAARSTDIVARYGGEEFVALLPEADEDAARGIAERIREALRATPVLLPDGQSVPVTGSFGVAVAAVGLDRLDADLDALVRSADLALYEAKRAGRDRTVVAGRHLDAA